MSPSLHRSIFLSHLLKPQSIPSSSPSFLLPAQRIRRRNKRTIYTHRHPFTSPTPTFTPQESSILSASLAQVPTHGFTEKSLLLGLLSSGYPEASLNLFPRGVFDLIVYHLTLRREALRTEVQFPLYSSSPPPSAAAASSSSGSSSSTKEATNPPPPPPPNPNPGFNPSSKSNAHASTSAISLSNRIHALTWARLQANGPIIHHWDQALAIMAQPSYIATSVRELGLLADEILYLAEQMPESATGGSGSGNDDHASTSLSSWYTRRMGLSAAYAASEAFMMQDSSKGFGETREFLGRRLDGLEAAGGVVGDVGEWMAATVRGFGNVARSKGVWV